MFLRNFTSRLRVRQCRNAWRARFRATELSKSVIDARETSPLPSSHRHAPSLAAWTRSFGTSGPLRHGEYEWRDPEDESQAVNLVYVDKQNNSIKIRGKVGDNVMYLAHRHKIEIEGACEASLACCTCHVYVDQAFFDKLPLAKDEEEDMLDLAPHLQENSRLSCQIILTKELEGMTLKLPMATRNFYVDGHVPEPH